MAGAGGGAGSARAAAAAGRRRPVLGGGGAAAGRLIILLSEPASRSEVSTSDGRRTPPGAFDLALNAATWACTALVVGLAAGVFLGAGALALRQIWRLDALAGGGFAFTVTGVGALGAKSLHSVENGLSTQGVIVGGVAVHSNRAGVRATLISFWSHHALSKLQALCKFLNE